MAIKKYLLIGLTGALLSTSAWAVDPKSCLQTFQGEAKQVCEKAIAGDPESQYQLARIYGDAQNSQMINYELSFYWHRELARNALKSNLKDEIYLLTMYNTGVFYADGIGVQQNLKNGIFWFQKAAERGEALSMLRLAVLYKSGLGVEKSDQTSEMWLNKAVKAGNPQAKVLKSRWILEGQISEKSTKLAIQLLEEAAKDNEPQACFALGNMHTTGFNVDKNPKKAKDYYSKACSLNLLEACKRYHDLDIEQGNFSLK
ncbi:tetratricopeptide repeat protein [Thiomicrorhabdus sp.]|uniref:tetratricopeptide repeat protein n=1 Tax=Thiomicrorhabdus sp. TaxID=2039724 RepID=UPI0029C9310F|nr:tetratricopeptide repeat protein [Thiomicrorhabdus sp.]